MCESSCDWDALTILSRVGQRLLRISPVTTPAIRPAPNATATDSIGLRRTISWAWSRRCWVRRRLVVSLSRHCGRLVGIFPGGADSLLCHRFTRLHGFYQKILHRATRRTSALLNYSHEFTGIPSRLLQFVVSE
jgi:hypothetical protein